MQNVRIIPSSPAAIARTFPRGLARRHSRRGDLVQPVPSASTFLRSLRSRPVTALLRYYGRCDSCPLRRGSARVISRRPPDRLLHGQVSLIHVTRSSDPSVSNHPCAPTVVFSRYPSTPWASRCRVWASPFPGRLASRTGRIEFLIVRMGRSPPVAPHAVSRRRSYLWLQAGERLPGKDFHLPNHARFQAHKGTVSTVPQGTDNDCGFSR